jgi:hypothetical protein
MEEKTLKVAPAIDRRRKTALERPLTIKEVSMLSSLRWEKKPLFGGSDFFFSDEYKKIMEIMKRPATEADFLPLLAVIGKDGNLKYSKEDFLPVQGKWVFLTEEQAKDLLGFDRVERYRPATAEEANILYSDSYSHEVTVGMEN